MPAADPLPIRPAPHEFEPLAEYVHRLAAANGLARRQLPAGVFNVAVPPAAVKVVAGWAGLDPERVRQMTPDRYPPEVAGTGPGRRGGWRLPASVRWWCPSCTPGTGRTDLRWQLALTPICGNCKVYLTAGPGSTPELAHPDVIDMVDELQDLLAASPTVPAAAQQLAWLRDICAGITTTDSHLWSAGRRACYYPLPAWGTDRPYAWNPYPHPDPATVVAVLMSAAPAMRQRDLATVVSWRTQDLVTHEQTHYRSGLGVLARGIRKDEMVSRRRLILLRKQLSHAAAAHGLQPAHIPGWLPGIDPHQPHTRLPAGVRWQAALTMHKLLSRVGDTPVGLPEVYRGFGLDTNTFPGSNYEYRHRMHAIGPAWRLAAHAIEVLVGDGLIDYQRRRAALRPLTRLPRQLRLPHRLPDTGPAPAEHLALGWIWQQLTRGPIFTSALTGITDAQIHTFGTHLDPETRLLLHEAGIDHIAASDLPEISTPVRRRRPAVTRSA